MDRDQPQPAILTGAENERELILGSGQENCKVILPAY